MTDQLTTYLHDHLSGANFGIELLKTLRDQKKDGSTAALAGDLLPEVEADRETLQTLATNIGGETPALKEAAAWLTEKISRFKLRHHTGDELGTFEALEVLALGIWGKRALWRALLVIAETDARVHGPNYEQLVARAESQHDRVEQRRIAVARAAFSTGR